MEPLELERGRSGAKKTERKTESTACTSLKMNVALVASLSDFSYFLVGIKGAMIGLENTLLSLYFLTAFLLFSLHSAHTLLGKYCNSDHGSRLVFFQVF